MQEPPSNPNPQQPYTSPSDYQSQAPYPPQAQAPYPPQQPYFQQPPQQQPKKRRGCLIGGIVAVVVVIAIIAAAASNGKSPTNTANTTTSSSSSSNSATQQPTATPTPSILKVGQSATLDGWTVTVNSAKTDQGGEFDQPQKTGDVFLLVSVTLVNATGSAQAASSILQFTLKDQNGQKYDETIDTNAASSPDGNLPNGQKLTGSIAYEVPGSMHVFTFSFTPGLTSTDEVDWSLSV